MKRSPAGGAIRRPITSIEETRLLGMSARGPANRWLSTTELEKSCMSVHQDTDTEVVVYVRLLDEGTDVWRPVHASALPDGTFRLREPDGYDPDSGKVGISPTDEGALRHEKV